MEKLNNWADDTECCMVIEVKDVNQIEKQPSRRPVRLATVLNLTWMLHVYWWGFPQKIGPSTAFVCDLKWFLWVIWLGFSFSSIFFFCFVFVFTFQQIACNCGLRNIINRLGLAWLVWFDFSCRTIVMAMNWCMCKRHATISFLVLRI